MSPAAFPSPGVVLPDQGGVFQQGAYEGMELRDWFAGQALAGLLATGRDYRNQSGTQGWAWHAEASYSMADAMLKAREVRR